jgi:hypothetical protein
MLRCQDTTVAENINSLLCWRPQGFDERHNCLIKDFGDTPRWVTNTAHKYVEYRLQGTENPKDITKPWYVNFHTARRSEDGCTGRWAYLK